MALGAALLGVPCRLYDNSYGKNEAVYRYSLAGRFANVRLMRDDAAPAKADAPPWSAHNARPETRKPARTRETS